MPDFAPYYASQTNKGGMPLLFADEVSGVASAANVAAANAASANTNASSGGALIASGSATRTDDSAASNETSSLATSLSGADNFVDFYAMLTQPMDAPSIQLRSRINEVYAEAQANRDHRNHDRRRQYALLLHWIPQARIVLLHEGKRARYDEYSMLAKNGTPPTDFRTALEEIIGETDLKLGEDESVLGLREDFSSGVSPAAARLSPRLDAVRAAAGEGAVKASATAATLNDVVSNAVAQNSEAETSIAPLPLASEVARGMEPDLTQPSVSNDETSSRKSSTRTKTPLNPELQRERAALLSSAVGGAAFLVVLLVARLILPQFSPIFLCIVALIAGFAARTLAFRQLSSGIQL